MNSAEVLIKFKGDTKDAEKSTNQLSASIGGLTKSFTLGNLAAQAITKTLGVMSSSMDSAIRRVDTMNNFPRVMDNLGVSAEDSAEVIKDLSKQLQGLPTTLDDAASAVQRFTSKNGDVKESEKLFLAVNNAILAGGASSSIQSSALEQLSQAYAKGKPDMMEWRTLMTAMPAQLKQVATAMGYVDAAMLGEAVRADGGEKEFARMMDTMMRMNTEGVNGFKSFDEQARNSTGGISTSVTNMKTAFVRGVGNIILKVNEALEPFGGLSGVLANIGTFGEQAFTAIGNVLAWVIPKVIEIGSWIIKNKDWLIPLTIAVVSFVAAFKTVSIITGIINGVKTAFASLNAVMSANPLGIIIGLIAALVATFIYCWNTCEGFRNFFIGMWEGIKTAFGVVVDFIGTGINMVVNFFVGMYNGIASIVGGIATVFSNVFNAIVNIVKTPINWIIDGINLFIRGLNKIKIPDWVPGIGGLGLNLKTIPRLNVGTNYVPEDQIAMIHKGEAVIPKKFNPYANGSFTGLSGSMQSKNTQPIINVYADVSTDPLGQTVTNIKTFSGGARNDYNYGMGA